MYRVFGLASIIAILVITSCSKENATLSNSTKEPGKASSKNLTTAVAGFRMVWAFDPWRWTCLPVPENCHPVDIVIKGRRIDEVNQLFAIAATESNANIRSYMEANQAVLSTVIPEEWIDAGVDGTYDVRYHFSKENNTHFLLFKTGDDIIMAFPIIEEA